MTATQQWFGEYFSQLHPSLQKLHTHGGSLSGDVQIEFGTGISGFFGRKMAKKLGVPTEEGNHQLQVTIAHIENELHWSRCFNNTKIFNSIFTPVGNKPTGYWIEKSGPIQLNLTVDIKDQGWYWQPEKVKFRGIPLPMWLLPKTTAYKKIESGKYRFTVNFSLSLFGKILTYSGLLTPEINSPTNNPTSL